MSDRHHGSGRVERRRRVYDELRVAPGTPANLPGRDTSWDGGEEFEHLSSKKLDSEAKHQTRALTQI